MKLNLRTKIIFDDGLTAKYYKKVLNDFAVELENHIIKESKSIGGDLPYYHDIRPIIKVLKGE